MKAETGPARHQEKSRKRGSKKPEGRIFPTPQTDHAPLSAWTFSPGLWFRAKNSCNPSAEAENALPAAQRAVPWNPEP